MNSISENFFKESIHITVAIEAIICGLPPATLFEHYGALLASFGGHAQLGGLHKGKFLCHADGRVSSAPMKQNLADFTENVKNCQNNSVSRTARIFVVMRHKIYQAS